MNIEELQIRIKDLLLEISAYENKVKELNNLISRQDRTIEELRTYIRENLTTRKD